MNFLDFFNYEHLPDHLQKISKPFSDLVHKINNIAHDDCAYKISDKLFEDLILFVNNINVSSYVHLNQRDLAIESLLEAQSIVRSTIYLHDNDCISSYQKILEAKDCAVRASIIP
jgi:hypothetical protein